MAWHWYPSLSKINHQRWRKLSTTCSQRIASRIYFQIIGNSRAGASPNLFLFTDQERILFGSSENVHRIMNELDVRIPKITDIFTFGTTHCFNGLPGILVFAASPGQKNPINVYGFDRIKKYLDHCNIFKKTSQMNYKFQFLSENLSSDKSNDNIELYLEQMIPLQDNVNLYPIVTSVTKDIFSGPEKTVSYIGHLRPGPGKFYRDKAESYGIPKSDWSRFYGGNAYKLPSGCMVYPEDVMGPPESRPSFAILDFTHSHSVDAMLLSVNNIFTSIETNSAKVSIPKLVFLYSNTAVLKSHPLLVRFLERLLATDTYLIYIDTERNCSSDDDIFLFHSHAQLQKKLNQISSKFFPRACKEQITKENNHGIEQFVDSKFEKQISLAENGMKFHIAPSDVYGPEFYQPEIDHDLSLTSSKRFPEHSEKRVNIGDRTPFKCGKDPKLVFLGTCGSLPTKRRNVSSLLVELSPEANILIDCGEGTSLQLLHHYGDKFEDSIAKIELIFVSHLHLDHHMGLRTILRHCLDARKKKQRKVLAPLLVGPYDIMVFLRRLIGIGNNYLRPSLNNFYTFKRWNEETKRKGKPASHFLKMNNLSHLEPFPVQHGGFCHGLKIGHEEGWKIVHSSDTNPHHTVVDAARNATLLIHDATFEKGQEHLARKVRHSTVDEAVEVAKQANAQHLILTHFSQRHLLPALDYEKNPNVGVAFDHAEFHLSELSEYCGLTSSIYQQLDDDIQHGYHRKEKK